MGEIGWILDWSRLDYVLYASISGYCDAIATAIFPRFPARWSSARRYLSTPLFGDIDADMNEVDA